MSSFSHIKINTNITEPKYCWQPRLVHHGCLRHCSCRKDAEILHLSPKQRHVSSQFCRYPELTVNWWLVLMCRTVPGHKQHDNLLIDHWNQWFFRKSGTIGTPVSQAEIDVCVQAPRVFLWASGVSPWKIFKIAHEKSCNLLHFWTGKWFTTLSTMRSKTL